MLKPSSTANSWRLVFLLIRRDLKVKYRGSVLGYLWSMLNPILFMLIATTVFSRLVRGIPNYGAFVFAGILAWNLASQSLSLGTHFTVANGFLLRKVKVSAWVFAIAPLGTCLTNFFLALLPFAVYVLVTTDVTFSAAGLLALPVVLALYAAFLAGAILLLSTANVFFRDVGHVLEPVLQLTFYATPILYDRHTLPLPETVKALLPLNPFVHFIEAIRACLVGGGAPGILDFGLLAGVSAASLALGLAVHLGNRRKIIFNL